MESNENRTILPKFKTYQQTAEFSGHCAVIVMVLNYLGETNLTERQCMIDLGMPEPDNYTEGDDGYLNYTDIESMRKEIQKFGFNTTTNNNFTEGTRPFNDSLEFSE